MRSVSFTNIFMAALFIFIGVWLLLGNMGLVSMGLGELLGTFIAFVIFIYGLWNLLKPLLRGRGPHWFIGLFCTVYGGLLLADDFNIGSLSFHWTDFWRLWPLVLIYIGFEIVGPIRFKRSYNMNRKNHRSDEANKYWNRKGTSVFNVVKECHFNEPNWPVEPMNLRGFVSDYEFDFTKAFIPDRETEIQISGFVGDIDVVIPEDVAFMVKGEANIVDVNIGEEEQSGVGSRDLFYKTQDFDEASRRIVLDVSFKILDLNIDRV
ncbi:lia operon protein LiaF [Pullulanibacillus pueri]|uniref:Lia operon protein LiaF n=1 Tax=Pullulanibacillus pueri TaxID=1437324 RepID=A0A8J2ZYW1_9BACL|nr:cell wall-active antibiotics response protein LiaF [Pullulanibacillus pueri]MBM7683437.1 lia operon protein LiaF [Pullulanibacillus pueri]GGH87399.1 hypothetical protein GCM10007096_37330 [Pullulanibacillus pueri]